MAKITLAERLWRRMTRDPSGCWVWTGKLDRYGYGRIWDGRRHTSTHRVAYELLVGPVPADLVIDHLCRNRACVNPSHMEPVTNAENVRRGDLSSNAKGDGITCRNGHPIAPETTRWRGTWRVCLVCTRERKRRYRDRLT